MMSPRVRADILFLIMVVFVILFVLVSTRYSRADSRLPGGVTCEMIVRYAADLGIPNTRWGRAQAKIIAATLGIYVTDAQLAAAAECLRSASAVPIERKQ